MFINGIYCVLQFIVNPPLVCTGGLPINYQQLPKKRAENGENNLGFGGVEMIITREYFLTIKFLSYANDSKINR